MITFVFVLLAFVAGVVLGYTLRRPRIHVERVEIPVPQIQRVEVEKLRVERVDVPGPRVEIPVPAKPEPREVVSVVFMDRNERKVHGRRSIDARIRKPVIVFPHGDVIAKYRCARQDADGRWIYRQEA